MKALITTLIAVIALAAPGFAQTVDIVCVDNGSGSITIRYENASEAIAGVSLLVTLSGGDAVLSACSDAGAVAPFNANIDYWYTTGGTPDLAPPNNGCPVGDSLVAGLPTFSATTFAISTGVLADPPAGAASGNGDICTLQLTGSTATTVTLSDDIAGRGGIVTFGASPAPFTVSYPGSSCEVFAVVGCPCRGDLSTDGINPATSGDVTFGDFNYFLGQFGAAAPTFVISPIPADMLCADLSTDGINPETSGDITFGDFNYFLGQFGSYAPTFVGPCLP